MNKPDVLVLVIFVVAALLAVITLGALGLILLPFTWYGYPALTILCIGWAVVQSGYAINFLYFTPTFESFIKLDDKWGNVILALIAPTVLFLPACLIALFFYGLIAKKRHGSK